MAQGRQTKTMLTPLSSSNKAKNVLVSMADVGKCLVSEYFMTILPAYSDTKFHFADQVILHLLIDQLVTTAWQWLFHQ